jgi:K+-sensing histidine kinase KdpD
VVIRLEKGTGELMWATAVHIARNCQQSCAQSRVWRVSLLVALGAGLGLLATVLPEVIERHHPFVIFFPYLVFAAWYGDVWEGLLAVVLSTTASVLLRSSHTSFMLNSGDVVAELCVVIGAVLLIVLVHRARRTQRAAQQAQRVAERAVQLRNDLLLAIAHDLRTPLTSILGRVEVMHIDLHGSKPLDKNRLDAQVDGLRGPARRMLAMVDDMTKAADVPIGDGLRGHLEAVDIGMLVQDTARLVAEGTPGAAPVTVEAAAGPIVEGTGCAWSGSCRICSTMPSNTALLGRPSTWQWPKRRAG